MKLIDVTKRYGSLTVIDKLNLTVEDGKITAILGASGVGKTTLIHILAGNTEFEGTVEGRQTSISYLFQEPRLLPNLTVENNLDYALRGQIKNKTLRKQKIDEVLAKVGLSADKKKFPKQLSGGMAQRVGIARAFASDAALLLMDEPFKELDFSLKKRIISVFCQLYSETPKTTVLVTHDLEEALKLADRILVMEQGGKISVDVEVPKNFAERQESDVSELRQRLYQLI